MRVVACTLMAVCLAFPPSASAAIEWVDRRGGPGGSIAFPDVPAEGAPQPGFVVVDQGATITWTGNFNPGAHPLAGDGPIGGYDGPAASYPVSFPSRGLFNYFCVNHPRMTGQVRVGNDRPAPSIAGPATDPAPGQTFTLRVPAGNDPDHVDGDPRQVRWDLDGDAATGPRGYETSTGAQLSVEVAYATAGPRAVGVEVTDYISDRGTAGATISVREPDVAAPDAAATPTPAPTGEPPPGGVLDRQPPVLTVRPRPRTLSALARVGLRVTVRSTEDARGELALSAPIRGRRVALGARDLELEAGRDRLVELRPPAAVRRRLEDLESLKVTATVSVRDAAGNTGRARARVTLRR